MSKHPQMAGFPNGWFSLQVNPEIACKTTSTHSEVMKGSLHRWSGGLPAEVPASHTALLPPSARAASGALQQTGRTKL